MEGFILTVQDEPLAATMNVWLDPDVEADATALEQFRREAMGFHGHWSSFAHGVPAPHGRLVTFTFCPEHIPYSLEALREWLRTKSYVRLIEIEHYAF